jgi:hypothetical protein
VTQALDPKVPESLAVHRGSQHLFELPLSGCAHTLTALQPSSDAAVDSLRASSSTAEQRTLNPQVSGSNPEGRTAGGARIHISSPLAV